MEFYSLNLLIQITSVCSQYPDSLVSPDRLLESSMSITVRRSYLRVKRIHHVYFAQLFQGGARRYGECDGHCVRIAIDSIAGTSIKAESEEGQSEYGRSMWCKDYELNLALEGSKYYFAGKQYIPVAMP